MKLQFTECVVIEKIFQTLNSATFVLGAPKDIQHGLFTSKYIPGQHTLVRDKVDDQTIERAYSLSSHPKLDKHPMITIKSIIGGFFSNHMISSVQVGTKLQVSTPMGNYKLVTSFQSKHHVFFAAGSGITPIFPMIKELLNFTNDTCTLFYANVSSGEVIFAKEVRQMSQASSGRFELVEFLETLPTETFSGQFGRITADYIKPLQKRILGQSMENYICGPLGFIDSVQSALKNNGVSRSKVHVEYFSAPKTENVETLFPTGDKNVNLPKVRVLEEGKTPAYVSTVKLSIGDEVCVAKIVDGESITEAGLRLGINVPFSCLSGTCGMCLGRVAEGEVIQKSQGVLTRKQLENGLCLTCQSNPSVENTLIVFDKR